MQNPGGNIGVQRVERATATLPQTTQSALFTVSGRVTVVKIEGEVTTQIEAQANDAKLISNPTVGADVDMCAAVETNADAVGTLYSVTGTLADAMVATTSGAFEAQSTGITVTAGTIDLDCANSNTGSVKWVIHYIEDLPGSTITAA